MSKPLLPTIIGISGVTCAGKTTLAQKLVQHLGNKCVVLNQDHFYRSEDDPNHQWLDISPGVRHQNWEIMSSINWQSFTQALDTAINKNYEISSDRYVIIEGHLIFNYKPFVDIFDNKFFITLEKEECFRRRNDRTYLPKDPKGYFENWVWPMYLLNLNSIKQIQNHIPIEFLDGNKDPNVLFDSVIKSL